MQQIYSDPTFQMACDQFELIADHLQIPGNLRARLMYPKRSIVVSVPVRMDDGSTQLFQGYRVQHTLSMGPTKGGTRFGNVGAVAAHGLAYKNGMKIIGISDVSGAYHNPHGIDVRAAEKYALGHGGLKGFPGAEPIPAGDLLTLPCDVLVPAAVSGVITGENAGKIRCRLLAEGANGPTTVEADRILFERWNEIFVIPDILCNAGGVIVSYFEWIQSLQSFFWNETEVADRLFRVLEQSSGDWSGARDESSSGSRALPMRNHQSPEFRG